MDFTDFNPQAMPQLVDGITKSPKSTVWAMPCTTRLHICQNSSMMTDLMSFNSYIVDEKDKKVPIYGVGSVVLRVKTRVKVGKSGDGVQELSLKNVLYAPSLPFNILGSHYMRERQCTVSFEKDVICYRSAQNKSIVALVEPELFPSLLLEHGHTGKSVIAYAEVLQLGDLKWPEEERLRFATSKARTQPGHEQGSAGLLSQNSKLLSQKPKQAAPQVAKKQDQAKESGSQVMTLKNREFHQIFNHFVTFALASYGDHKYSKAEKAWLRNNYDHESAFLDMWSLSIDSTNDRADGRKLVRALMDKSGNSGHGASGHDH